VGLYSEQKLHNNRDATAVLYQYRFVTSQSTKWKEHFIRVVQQFSGATTVFHSTTEKPVQHHESVTEHCGVLYQQFFVTLQVNTP